MSGLRRSMSKEALRSGSERVSKDSAETTGILENDTGRG